MKTVSAVATLPCCFLTSMLQCMLVMVYVCTAGGTVLIARCASFIADWRCVDGRRRRRLDGAEAYVPRAAAYRRTILAGHVSDINVTYCADVSRSLTTDQRQQAAAASAHTHTHARHSLMIALSLSRSPLSAADPVSLDPQVSMALLSASIYIAAASVCVSVCLSSGFLKNVRTYFH